MLVNLRKKKYGKKILDNSLSAGKEFAKTLRIKTY